MELKHKRICVHGTGKWGSACLEWLIREGCRNIVVVDSDKDKWDKQVSGLIIKNPKDITDSEIDIYIIGINNYNPVFNWIAENLNISVEKIYIFRKDTLEIQKPYCLPSYSQEGEDIYLQEVLSSVNKGVYVDVGAHHPFRFSNTYWAYKKEWKGINIEPNPNVKELFCRYRPDDINLFVGISDKEGVLNYYCYEESALNGFDKNAHNNVSLKEIKEIPVRKLESVLSEYNITHIDFISIDVEGFEINVLKSIDWDAVTIDYMVIEQLIPLKDVFKSEEYIYLEEKGYELVAKYGRSSIYKLCR